MGERPAEQSHGSGSASRVLAVGGSAGSLSPLTQLLQGLPAEMGIAVLVAVHRGSGNRSMLTSILNRHSVLRAAEPRDGDPLLADSVYVAPPDRHLEVMDGRLKVVRSRKVNGQRPAVDVLFESAARWYGPATVAVVLSGVLDDGSPGLRTVERAGGHAIVQDPADAEFDGMPLAALERVPDAEIAAGGTLAQAVIQALQHRVGARLQQSPEDRTVKRTVDAPLGAGDEAGTPIGVTCPERSGTLWLSGDPEDPVLSCRIGHRMSPGSLGALQSDRLERALWAALRALEEQVAVAEFMETMSRRREDFEGADRQRQRRDIAAKQTETMREFLLGRDGD